jgi:hypothetical protein
LDRYYEAAGKGDLIRIKVSAGSYAPTFYWRRTMPAPRAGDNIT